MNKEQVILISATIFLTILGLGAMVGVVMLRPSTDNSTLIREIAGFIVIIAMQFLGLMKSTQNGTDITVIKNVQDGQTTHAIAQAATVATLTEQLAASNTAANLAAITAQSTALALAAKVADTTAIVKENGLHHKE